MNKLKIKIFILVSIFTIYLGGNANAIMKLDFISPPSDFLNKVQKQQEKYMEQYNSVLLDLHNRVLKGTGAEGAALFDVVAGSASNMAFNQINGVGGQVGMGSIDFGAGANIDKSMTDLANYKLDMETTKNMLADYKKALADEKRAKDLEIDKQILEAEAILASSTDDEEIKEYSIKLATLEAAKAENLGNQELRQKKIVEKEKELKQISKKVSNIDEYVNQQRMTKALKEKTANLFTEEETEAENEDIYETDIKKFFLKKKEYEGGENNARINKARRYEYYIAIQNAMRATLQNNVRTEEISNNSTSMVDVSTEADSVYGAMSMRIGVDVQNAKSAARFTELLLAQIRLETMADVLTWNDKFKLKDYDHDVTKFNLDYYILDKSDDK